MAAAVLIPVSFALAGAATLHVVQRVAVLLGRLRTLARERDEAVVEARVAWEARELSEGRLRLAEGEVARLLERVEGLRLVSAVALEARWKGEARQ